MSVDWSVDHDVQLAAVLQDAGHDPRCDCTAVDDETHLRVGNTAPVVGPLGLEDRKTE
jgi:hypothetical protein